MKTATVYDFPAVQAQAAPRVPAIPLDKLEEAREVTDDWLWSASSPSTREWLLRQHGLLAA